MNQPSSSPSRLYRAASGFATMSAILLAVLIMPLIATPVRTWASAYLHGLLPAPHHEWSGWGVVIVLGLAIYHAISALLVGIIVSLFRSRAGSRYRGM